MTTLGLQKPLTTGPRTLRRVGTPLLRTALSAFALLLIAGAALAGAMLEGFPTADDVNRKLVFTNEIKTHIARAAAYDMLEMQLMGNGSGPGRALDPQEQARYRSYVAGWQQANSDGPAAMARAKGTTLEAESSEFVKLTWKYRDAPAFQSEVIDRIFPAGSPVPVKMRMKAELRQSQAVQQKAQEESANRAATIAMIGVPAVLFGLLLIVLVWLWRNLTMRVGFQGSGHELFAGAQRNYQISHCTGVVSGSKKLAETQVYGGGGTQGNSSPVSSRMVTHDEFFLNHPGGVHPVQLVDWNLPVENGHVVSVVLATPQGKGKSRHILIANHSTDRTYFADNFIREMVAPNMAIGCLLFPLVPLFWAVKKYLTERRLGQFKKQGADELRLELGRQASALQR